MKFPLELCGPEYVPKNDKHNLNKFDIIKVVVTLIHNNLQEIKQMWFYDVSIKV